MKFRTIKAISTSVGPSAYAFTAYMCHYSIYLNTGVIAPAKLWKFLTEEALTQSSRYDLSMRVLSEYYETKQQLRSV